LLASPSVEVADGRLYTFVPGYDPVARRPEDAAKRADAGVEPRANDPGVAALDTDGNRLPGCVGLESLQERLGENAEHLLDRGVSVDRLMDELGVDQPEVGDTRTRTVRDQLEPQYAAELLNPALLIAYEATPTPFWKA